MRMMVRFSFPNEEGNEGLRNGKVLKVFGMIMEELKPEAVYLYPEGGQRGGIMVFDMQRPEQVAEVGERFWFGLGADVEMTPVMTGEDLQKAMPVVEGIAKRYS